MSQAHNFTLHLRKILAEEETEFQRNGFFSSITPPFGSTTLGVRCFPVVGGRDGPAARTEVALICFHTVCDRALEESIVGMVLVNF